MVCPSCENSQGLWASATFEGWHAVKATSDGKITPARRGTPYYEVHAADLIDVWADDMGCSCGWEGRASQLVQLGIDGIPLPKVNPSQMMIGDS